MTFKPEILFAFVALEVFCFNADARLQALISILEYLLVAIVLLQNTRVGLMYFISFSLLSMGAWSHVLPGSDPANFWGLRVASFSVNTWFTLLVLVICMCTRDLRVDARGLGPAGGFLSAFMLYSLTVGIVAVILSVNYADNFARDIVYLVFFVYLYFVLLLDTTSVYAIIKYGVSATIVAMVLSFLTDTMFFYGGESRFVLMNSFGFIAVFAVFFMRDLYSPWHFRLLVVSMLMLLLSGTVFLGAKALVIMAVAIVWSMVRSFKVAGGLIVLTVLVVTVGTPVLQLISTRVSEQALLAYKFAQIFDVFSVADVAALSATQTSMGNIIAEGRTILQYSIENPLALLVGKGFGGGIPDLFGDLTPLARPGAGYAIRDVARNDFFRMHLPVFDIAVKSGIVGLTAYSVLLVHFFRRHDVFALVGFMLLATVFTNSKEMLLLTVVFLTVAARHETNSSDNATQAGEPQPSPA